MTLAEKGIKDEVAYNRTMLELKWRFRLYCAGRNNSYNRTMLELKYGRSFFLVLWKYTYNRTMLELKSASLSSLTRSDIFL